MAQKEVSTEQERGVHEKGCRGGRRWDTDHSFHIAEDLLAENDRDEGRSGTSTHNGAIRDLRKIDSDQARARAYGRGTGTSRWK